MVPPPCLFLLISHLAEATPNQQLSVSGVRSIHATVCCFLWRSAGSKIAYLKLGMKSGHDIYTNKNRILRKRFLHRAIKHIHTQSLLAHLNVNFSRQRLSVSSSSRDCDEGDVRRHHGFKEIIILTYGHAQRHQSWRGYCTKW